MKSGPTSEYPEEATPDETRERDCIERSKAGSTSAFRELMEAHQDYAFAVAHRLIRRTDVAEDIVQESFLRVWAKIGDYEPKGRFRSWLYRIVVNLCYDTMRRDRVRERIVAPLERLAAVADKQRYDDSAEAKDTAARVLSAARTLPPRQRLVFILRDVQDFDLLEIAELSGISVNSVKANLSYARQRLRKIIADQEKFDGTARV